MHLLHPIISAFGIGFPELIVIMVVLTLLAAVVAVAICAFAIIIRGRKRENEKAKAGITSEATHKKCPDCAELVLIDARVCKHCGCKFKAGGTETA